MSFPNITDINSLINIKKADSISLLLSSIALEEKSLSDLIDAEVRKIRSVADRICVKHNAGEIISINRSVDQTLKNIIKLQMMLQFKLDKLHEIFLLAAAAEDGGAITGATANDGTAEATSSSCCAAEAANNAAASFVKMQSVFACKKGKFISHADVKGCVLNPNDSYYRGTACVSFSISSGTGFGFKAGYLYYKANNGYNAETFKASPDSIKIESVKRPNRIKLSGHGAIIKDTGTQIINDNGRFELTLWRKFMTKKFQMVIAADNKPVLNHDSGEVIVKRGNDNENSYFNHVWRT